MPIRTAKAEWKGTLKDGQGTVALGSGAFEGRYSFPSRFEEGEGTNPEELVAAAHAGCFSMALSGGLTRAGLTPESIRTTARLTLEKTDAGFTITRIALSTEGKVPGTTAAAFQEHAETAKKNCPISRALNVPEITLEARLLT